MKNLVISSSRLLNGLKMSFKNAGGCDSIAAEVGVMCLSVGESAAHH